MKHTRLFLLLTSIISFWPGGLAGQGFRLSLHVPDLKDGKVILAHRFGFKFYTDDTVKTDESGNAVFEGAGPMPEGMYQLVFPDKKYSEFFIGKKQDFSILTKIAAPTDSLSFQGSPENTRFLEWQKKYAFDRNRSSRIQNRLKKGNLSPNSTALLNRELKQIQQSGNLLWETAIRDLSGTLAGEFIKGLRPVPIPAESGKPDSPDSQMRQYYYLRLHFFDNIDLADERLLRTPLIESKLEQYFKQIVPQLPDTLISEVTQVIGRSKAGGKMYQFIVQYLFNLYSSPEIMGTDAVYVYIAENYYLKGKSPWVDSTNLNGIRARVKDLKPLLLGSAAPVLEGLVNMNEQPVEIKDIKSKYLILYFWSPDCSFCKESIPKLKDQYAGLKQLGAEVVAIDTRLDKELWIKFITEKQLTWINACSPPSRVKDMIEKYQAYTTPSIFILDANRRIIAKSISVDQIIPFLTQYAGH